METPNRPIRSVMPNSPNRSRAPGAAGNGLRIVGRLNFGNETEEESQIPNLPNLPQNTSRYVPITSNTRAISTMPRRGLGTGMMSPPPRSQGGVKKVKAKSTKPKAKSTKPKAKSTKPKAKSIKK